MHIYCPYSDEKISKDKSNIEHIIPISLGGSNKIENKIQVSAEVNSKLGSEIDGKLANDFILRAGRSKNNCLGHSRKKDIHPKMIAVDQASGNPVQVTFDQKKGVKAYDLINKKYLSGRRKIIDGIPPPIQLDVYPRFLAKVALAYGYKIYGDKFIKYIDHNYLRLMMNNQSKIQNYTTLYEASPTYQQVESILDLIKTGTVIHFKHEKMFVMVKILGYLIGVIYTDADIKSMSLKTMDTVNCIIITEN